VPAAVHGHSDGGPGSHPVCTNALHAAVTAGSSARKALSSAARALVAAWPQPQRHTLPPRVMVVLIVVQSDELEQAFEAAGANALTAT
jgi:hypothetical protein